VRAVPVFASYTLAFALQLRKKRGKTSVRVNVLLFPWWMETNCGIFSENTGLPVPKPTYPPVTYIFWSFWHAWKPLSGCCSTCCHLVSVSVITWYVICTAILRQLFHIRYFEMSTTFGVQISLYDVPEKVQRGRRGYSSTPFATRYPLYKGAGWDSGLIRPGFDPWTVQPVANLYTDYDVPAAI
jgi:hypothetical protein